MWQYAVAIAYSRAGYSSSLVPLCCGRRCIRLLYIDCRGRIAQTTCSWTQDYPSYECGRDELAPIDSGAGSQEFGAIQYADNDGQDIWLEAFGIHSSNAHIS